MLRYSVLHRNAAPGLKLLLQPILSGTNGPVVEKLGLGSHLPTVTLPPPSSTTGLRYNDAQDPSNNAFFGCFWDGAVGFDSSIIENYFVVLSSGFDIVRWDLEEQVFDIKHTRRFLGWQPDDKLLSVRFEATCLLDNAASKVKYVNFQSQILPTLQEAKCPGEVLACLTRPESMKMLIALRRSKVRAEYITHTALTSATKKVDSWSSALGVL